MGVPLATPLPTRMRLLTRTLLWLCLLCLLPGPLPAQASLIVLVRHAEKSAERSDPGLTRGGEKRAADLAGALEGARLTAIYTTQYRRTRLTAEPVAHAQGLTPMVLPASGDLRSDAAAVAAAINALPAGSAALVVGHSNTLGPIIAALGGPPVPDLCDGEYATLLILERPTGGTGPQLLRSRFGAADLLGATECGGP